MDQETLLRAIWSMMGRQSFTEADVLQIVAPKGKSETQIAAYNMCDGEQIQANIVKALKLDSSNFSKTLSRWVDAGIVIRLGDKGEKPLHVYPLTKENVK